MLTNRLHLRTASSRGGFTLVELLVVIGIIAILAGVALGPITAGIQKAKQSGGLQEAHVLGLAMYSAANDNSQLYPDKSGGGASANDIASQLLSGGYINDATIFQISGDNGTGFIKLTSSNNTAATIGSASISWDFTCSSNGSGISSTSNTYWPLLWSTVFGGTSPNAAPAGANTDNYAIPVSTNPFGAAGMAVFYINNSANFVTSKPAGGAAGGTSKCDVVPAANNLNGPPTSSNSGTVATASGV